MNEQFLLFISALIVQPGNFLEKHVARKSMEVGGNLGTPFILDLFCLKILFPENMSCSRNK